jgi:hypothetical protein
MTLLTGCGAAGGARLSVLPEPQEMPQDVKTCLLALYGPPPAGDLSKRAAAVYIDGFNIHDLRKTQCGRRAIAWVEGRPTTPR